MRQIVFLPALLSALLFAGCSSDRTEGTRSVEDSLAEMERAKKSMESPTKVVDETGSMETSPALEISKSNGEVVNRESTSSLDDSADPGDVPETFRVKFESSSGDYVVEVHRDWAPRGAKRFYDLVKAGFYDECRYFRVVPGFMVQFGMNGDPSVQAKWETDIQDDPVIKSNRKGYVTFANRGPDSRTTQIFISFGNNSFLDTQHFAPFGQIVEGMHNVEAIYSGHAENPQQDQIKSRGNAYLTSRFPELDYVKKAYVIETPPAP